MKEDTFLLSLISFSDLKQNSPRQLVSIQNQDQSDDKLNRLTFSPYNQLEFQVHNNQILLQNSKQLRQEMKQSARICELLRKKNVEKQNENQQIKIREKLLQASIAELKNQLQHKNKIIQGYKVRFSQNESYDFLKKTIQQLKSKISQMEKQKYQVIEMSIIDKIQLQEKIKKYEASKLSDLDYVQNIQSQLNSMREKCLKLQNDLKNLQIKYEYQKYNRKWDQKGFQLQYLMSELKKQQKQNAELYFDFRKQKELNNELETKIRSLEQSLQIFKLKNQTYMMENISLHKKAKTIQKNYEKKGLCIDAKDQQIAKIDKKLQKIFQLYEELLSRIKRSVSGDLMCFVKRNEYKFNKIKQQNRFNTSTKVLSQIHKKTSKKQKKKESEWKKETAQRYLNTQRIQKGLFSNTLDKFDIIQTQINENSNKKGKVTSSGLISTQITAQDKQNIYEKIRRQRDQLQKKIRLKMSQRKKLITDELQCEDQKFLSYIKN